MKTFCQDCHASDHETAGCCFYYKLRQVFSMYEDGLYTEAEVPNRLQHFLPPPWIPTRNNRPQEGQYVLVHMPSGDPNIRIAQYLKTSEGDFSFLVIEGFWMAATDWMFLPEPPKEGYV